MYQYGFKTRTAILGAIVAISGLLVVVARLLLFQFMSTARMKKRDFDIAAFRSKTPRDLLSKHNLKAAYGTPLGMDLSMHVDEAEFDFEKKELIHLTSDWADAS